MEEVIEKTQIDAYIDFVAKYPDIKFGQRTLDKLKPFFVFFGLIDNFFSVGNVPIGQFELLL
jgi:hypothetical protein